MRGTVRASILYYVRGIRKYSLRKILIKKDVLSLNVSGDMRRSWNARAAGVKMSKKETKKRVFTGIQMGNVRLPLRIDLACSFPWKMFGGSRSYLFPPGNFSWKKHSGLFALSLVEKKPPAQGEAFMKMSIFSASPSGLAVSHPAKESECRNEKRERRGFRNGGRRSSSLSSQRDP